MAAGDVTPGRRRADGTAPWELEPGDYCRRDEFLWVVAPNGNGPARLEGWDVVWHDGGTVTASPSILAHASGAHAEWHGYLERGVWREV